MSKRLQVVVDDNELQAYEQSAKAVGLSVSGWVRQTLRSAQHNIAGGEVHAKLAVIRRGFSQAFPAPDIDAMLAEIERGYFAPDKS